jgi:O-antigen ligase
MLGSVKALIVVLAISTAIFFMAKPLAKQFMSEEDFSRRRFVWYVLTTVGLLSPNEWVYFLFAVPTLLWAGRKDSNPVALYLLLMHVVPPIEVTIPLPGNHGLFLIDNYRLLALCVLLPAAMRYRKNPQEMRRGTFGLVDVLLLAFGALQVALYTPPDLPFHVVIPDSPTNMVRRVLMFLLDTYLLYYAFSRLLQSRKKMVDAMASFVLICGVMSALAMFERTRNWLLFVDIAGRWSTDPNATFYLMRGGSVRAQVTAGHSIALGLLISIAFGLSLYLMSHLQGRSQRIGVALLLWGGLFGAFSRGAWLGAGVIYFTFIAAGPRAASRFVKGACIAGAVIGIIALSPLGDRIIELLPKGGQPADLYRHRLAEQGWKVALEEPFFGNQFPWPELEDLRQGEGIIDLVNSYLEVALGYGLVGLFFFASTFLLGTLKVYSRSKELSRSDPDLALLGTSLFACAVGLLIMIRNTSLILGTEKMFWVLAGFAVAYATLEHLPLKRPHGSQRQRLSGSARKALQE